MIDDIGAIVLDPVDRSIFSWLQIKEKLGGLRMHYRVTLDLSPDTVPPDVLDTLCVALGERLEDDEDGVRLAIPLAIRERIFLRIDEAEKRCAVTCEVCGQPGELIREGWHRVRCEQHRSDDQ